MKITLPLVALKCYFFALATTSNVVTATDLFFGASSNNNDTTTPHQHHRILEPDDFVPLSCNNNLKRCKYWTNELGTDAVRIERVVIGCGECIEMDFASGPVLSLLGGLDIQGKLVIPDDYRLTLQATMIVVQGELEVTSTKPVDGDPMIRFIMIGENDEYFTPIDENANACGGKDCLAGKKGIVVAGGTVNINGIPKDSPTWVNLYDVTGIIPDEVTGIVVEASISRKWAVGAEILITSHTNAWDDHQVRKITKIHFDSVPGHVELKLDLPIRPPTTLLDDSDFAVEVALLSRNIVFEGGFDSKPGRGGHFWVMNTPSVVQTLVGVEIINFGQQGYLGRYPIHFHFCGDGAGSEISKNTIRQSNQRCVVVHGTNNLLVEGNIAYDTKGHCFILEDGMETGNEFIRNLGAQTGIPKMVIPNHGPNGDETDFDPATFWITNPNNTWIGNVAAGSESSGFWFELLLRGTRASMYPDLDPKRASLTLFKDNVAHSCQGRAVKTYPSGYLPDAEAEFLGMKLYRNNVGAFYHISRRLKITDSLFADNRFSLDIDRADAVKIRDSHFIGRSESYSNLLASMGVPNFCRRDNGPFVGIELHTWKNDPEEDGVTMENTNFTGFSNTPCFTSVPISVDDTIKTGMFDLYSAFKGIVIEDSVDPIDFCKADAQDIVDIYLTDLDGSLKPPTSLTSAPSSLVSDRPEMLNFVNDKMCTLNADRCYNYCEDTCFQSIRFEIDPAETEDYKLKVCSRRSPTDCILIPGYQRSDDPFWAIRHRVFAAHLPTGKYDAHFIDNRGEAVWPSFVDEHYEPSPCARSESDHSVKLIEPDADPNDCVELIRNGKFGESASAPVYWLHRFGGIQLAPGAGVRGTNAAVGNYNEDRTTIVQYLDNRCLQLMQGEMYEIKADYKLVRRDGSLFTCKDDERDCPVLGIYIQNLGFNTVARVPSGRQSDGYERLEGTVRLDSEIAAGEEVFLYIDSNIKSTRLYVDNVSMTLVQSLSQIQALTSPTSDVVEGNCSNMIENSEMKLDWENFWEVNGFGTLSKFGSTIRYSDRLFSWNGPYYLAKKNMDFSCFTAGSSWVVRAQFQLIDAHTGVEADCLTSWTCPAVRIVIKDSAGKIIFWKKVRDYVSSTWNTTGFNEFKTHISLPSEEAWDGSVNDVVIDIRNWPIGLDLVVDEFSMEPLFLSE